MFKMYASLILFVVFSFSQIYTMNAQSVRISGRVSTAEDNSPLVGVTIQVDGKQIGTFSRAEGVFELEIPSPNERLVFSFIGFERQVIETNGRSSFEIRMVSDAIRTGDVVVTAFGLEREKKALGYSVQEISGSEILETKDANIVSSLAGRVAGVQVTSGVSGAGSTSRIVIRGESSLSGDNQPLFVVDGVPVANSSDFRSNRHAAANMGLDFGNFGADINPDDIESISVLKGPNATALYGSRAANGVVLITTKTGKSRRGLGISLNFNQTFESLLAYPEFQHEYGQGKNFAFDFTNGYGSGLFDGVDESWGPALDGRLIKQFDSPTTNGLRGGDVHGLAGILGSAGVDLSRRGDIQATPWTFHGDPWEDFFEVGNSRSSNVAFFGGNETGNFRLSYTNFDHVGMTPNTDLRRNTINFSAGYNLSEKLYVSASANYIKTDSDNRHVVGYGTESIPYLFTWWGMQINMKSLKNYWQDGLEGFQQYNYNYNYHDNPYFTMHENTNGMGRNRLIGNVMLSYNILDNLVLTGRVGTDYFGEIREIKRAFSTQRFPQGQYREDKINFFELNTDFLLTYNNKINGDFDYSVSFGGNQMRQKNHFNSLSANRLVIPEVYNFSNTDVSLVTLLEKQEKQINSLYAFTQLTYQNMIYLDITGRNDWSSTLPSESNSYFYPSVSLSAVLTDIFKIPTNSFLTFAKLRTSWAQVGSDTDPYRLQNTYSFTAPWGSNLISQESSQINNADLKPEIVSSFEIGTDIRLFENRIGLDFTWYNSNSENQILGVQIPISTGYTSQIINAGRINSSGIEIMLNANPIRLKNGFRWDIGVNYTYNRSIVKELAEGLDTYTVSSGSGVTVLAKEGERMGSMWGEGLMTNDDGKIVYRNGLPVRTNELKLLGNYNPDFTVGFFNSFKYGNFDLNVLVDWRQGGELVSIMRLIGATAGNVVETLWGRDQENGGSHPGIKDSGLERKDGDKIFYDGIIGDGVIEIFDDNGNVIGYRENDVIVSATAYHNTRYRRQNVEEGLYDATFIKLREVSIGYSIPTRWLEGLFFESAKISLVGRNLLLWTDYNHGDPETMNFTGQNMVPGVDNMALPSARTYGFNINIQF